MTMRRWNAMLAVLGVALMPGTIVSAMTAEVKDHAGSPMIHIDGEPVSPLMFFGWADGSGPHVERIGTEWREYHYTFIAPETTNGDSGIHFRVGGDGPGTVWVDDIKLYPGEKVDEPAVNLVRQGDWEGAREEISKDWTLFQAKYAGAKAEWTLDPTTKVSGEQSLRVDIEHAGENTMHLHFHQTRHSVQEGQKYTYSLWMKADRPRTVDFMALHIGGPWTIYGGVSSVYQEQVTLARGAGVRTYSFGIPMPWPKPGEEYNFAGVDRAIQATLAADPDGLLLPRFGMAPPAWWLDEHPDARMLFDDGRTDGFSMASQEWLADALVHLRALVRHCEARFGKNMLGYHPCGQHTGEWFYERSWEPRLSDFSPAMERGFARWLERKYGDAATLAQAWNRRGITFGNVTIPAPEEQLSTTHRLLRDPVKERAVIDWFEYKQVAMAEPLVEMSRVIKEETSRGKLVCLFYGYIFDMHGLPLGPQGSGHLAMRRLIDCADVDILCSPISYNDREQGGAGCFMSAVDSVRTGGKLWLNEDDTRTYLTPPDSGYGRVDNASGTYWVLERNFGQLWPRRLATWYMDLGNAGWFNGADIWDHIAPMQRLYQERIDEPAQWAPEIALVVDEESPCYTKCDRALHSPLVYQMRSQFYRIGAPFGIYLLSDLVAGRVPPAKVYFFANSFQMDDAERAAVKRETSGRGAVYLYGGGAINEDVSAANMSELTGLGMVQIEPTPGRVKPANTEWLGLTGEQGDFGTEMVLEPCWAVDPDGALVFGTYANGQAAAGAKEGPDGLRAYIGAVRCPAAILRGLARRCGVHIYSEQDDVILTDGKFLSITATSPGAKTVQLPEPRRVVSAFDGSELWSAVDALALDLQLGETRSYLLLPAAPQGAQ